MSSMIVKDRVDCASSTQWKARILIVDDDIHEREQLFNLYTDVHPDWLIITAKSAMEAIDIIDTAEPFDVILTDMRMHEDNEAGLLVVEAAKKRSCLTSVIVLTAVPHSGNVYRCLYAHVDQYLDRSMENSIDIQLNEVDRYVQETQELKKLLNSEDSGPIIQSDSVTDSLVRKIRPLLDRPKGLEARGQRDGQKHQRNRKQVVPLEPKKPPIPKLRDLRKVLESFRGKVCRIQDGTAYVELIDRAGNKSLAEYNAIKLQTQGIGEGAYFICDVIEQPDGVMVTFSPLTQLNQQELEAEWEQQVRKIEEGLRDYEPTDNY